MNKIRTTIATLTAAAAIATLSTTPGQAAPTPAITVPCYKAFGTYWASDRSTSTIKDDAGAIHYIPRGYTQKMCGISFYLHSGYDGKTMTGSNNRFQSFYTSTGWHNFSSAAKDPNNNATWVDEWVQ
jgi:hypothetical protein